MEEELLIQNKKGLGLAAIMHKPKNRGRKKVPVAILLHGFTGYKEETHIKKLAEDLAQNGFVAIRFDASGSGESEGTFEKDYRFGNYLEDTFSVIEYAKKQAFIDANNIFLWGHSMGGQLAFWVAYKDKSIKALCAVSSPQCIGKGDILEAEMEKIKLKGYYERTSTKLGHIKIPYVFFKNGEEQDVLKIISVIKQPKLIIWGTKDDFVLPSETEEIFTNATEPKEKLAVEGMNHDYKKSPFYIEKVNEKVVEFFSKCMK